MVFGNPPAHWQPIVDACQTFHGWFVKAYMETAWEVKPFFAPATPLGSRGSRLIVVIGDKIEVACTQEGSPGEPLHTGRTITYGAVPGKENALNELAQKGVNAMDAVLMANGVKSVLYRLTADSVDDLTEDDAKKLASGLARQSITELQADMMLWANLNTIADGRQLVDEVRESMAAKNFQLYWASLATLYTAMETATILALLRLGTDIRAEELANPKKKHYVPELVSLLEAQGKLSNKTADRLRAAYDLRRSVSHSKTGRLVREDSDFAWTAFREALAELFPELSPQKS
jgi:hypothetical protein